VRTALSVEAGMELLLTAVDDTGHGANDDRPEK
jgi:hypothetical protein